MTTKKMMTRHPLPMQCVLAVLATVLAGLLVGYEYLLLQWPLLREAHFLHYIGYLINEHHYAPYRDVLETSWFGTFLFHMAVGELFGYTGTAFRVADIAWLILLLTTTWYVLRELDNWLAWVGTFSAGLAYLHYGPANTLQRDYVLLLPIMLALLASLQVRITPLKRALLVGMCFGAAVSIKPHAIIGLPVILALLRSQSPTPSHWFALLASCAAGITLVFGTGLLWLAWRGGLADFLDMTLHYLPLYQSFNGAHQITTSAERWHNTLYWWKHFLWLWPYSVGSAVAYVLINTGRRSPQRALTLALAALAGCYNLYPLLAGKFWDYHWIPYTYFSVLATSALLLPPRTSTPPYRLLSIAALLAFLYAATTQYFPGRGIYDQIQRYPDLQIDDTYDDKVADFIRTHLRPGEKIQVIEQGGPASSYLLRAGAPLATPYLGSFMFLHHVDSPYVQHAQRHFLELLRANPPALFLVMADFTRPVGQGVIAEIPGLMPFLNENYQKIWETPSFTFWQHRQLATAPESRREPSPVLHSDPPHQQ